MQTGDTFDYCYDLLVRRLPPRFSPQFDADQGMLQKVGVVAASTLVLVGGAISYLAFPQLTFVAFVIGVALHPHVRHVVKSHALMFWNVTIVAKLALLFFSVPSITYISLVFPFFIGSFMAFHALENKDGKKSYFTAAPIPSEQEKYLKEIRDLLIQQQAEN